MEHIPRTKATDMPPRNNPKEQWQKTNWHEHRTTNELLLKYAPQHNATVARLQRATIRRGLTWLTNLDEEGVIYAIVRLGSRKMYIGKTIRGAYTRFKLHFSTNS